MHLERAENLQYVQSWWLEIHGHELPKDVFPPNRFYIVNDGKPIAYFGIHGMECSICYLGFPTISNRVRGLLRKKVFNFMCGSAKEIAKENGYSHVFLSIQGKAAAKHFLDAGFSYGDEKKGDIDAKHLFMRA